MSQNNSPETEYRMENRNGDITCILSVDNVPDICTCKMHVNQSEHSWTISSWFTKPEYKNKGYGKETMKRTMECCAGLYGMPESINYIWNGTNEYVLEWLNSHFDAVCSCPITVQKYNADDDWSSHIYNLNKDKVLAYFGIKRED